MYFPVLLLTCSLLMADTTGIIGGTLTDPGGVPLVGATVMVEETGFGAMTDQDGEYVIAGLAPGRYTVVGRMVGRVTSRMEGVEVVADRLTRIDFQLEEDPTGNTVIVVEESRRQTLQDVPTTVHMLDVTNTGTLSSRNIVDIVSSQPGVVVSGGEMHVRGGRTGEVDYILDGVSLRSPITKDFNLELPLSSISNAALMTGGLGVEYGNSMSGVVNLVGSEGGDRYHGDIITRYGDVTTASYDSRERLFMEETDNNLCRRGLTGLEGSLSGPEPLTGMLLPAMGIEVPGEVRFSSSGQFAVSGRDSVDTRDRWENGWRTDVSGIAKITYRPVNRTSIAFTILGSYQEKGWNEWAWSRYHLPAYIEGQAYLGRSQDQALPVRFSETSGMILNFTQLFGSETCLKMTLGRMSFQDWHRIRTPDGGYVGENTYPTYWLTLYHPEERVTDSLGFYHTGTHPNVWFDSKARVSSMALDFDYNPNTRTRLKAGLSASYYDLYQYNVYSESPASAYVSQWDAYPHSGSGFLQGSYRFSGGVIATAGIRMDLFDANTSVFDPELEQRVEVDGKWALSPRVGFSVPFSENSVFFTSYGHHFQTPSMECLYVQTSYNLAQDRIVAGNPDLDPELTQTFEVGIRHYIDMLTEVSLAAYYKDITGLVSTEDHYEGTYYVFTNDDSHGMARGLELILERASGSNISGQFSYTLSVAKGRYSSILDRYNYAQAGVYFLSSEDNYLDWDQTHTVGTTLELTGFEGEGPSLMGFHPLENSSLRISFRYGSGVPYTLPPASGDLVETNTERYPFTMQTDVFASRTFGLGPADLQLTAGVYNVFNRHNVVQIYDTALFHSTGEPGGELGNPRAWSPARHFAVSASVSW